MFDINKGEENSPTKHFSIMLSEETRKRIDVVVVATDSTIKDSDNALMLGDTLFVPNGAKMALNDKGYPFGVLVLFMDTNKKGHLRLLRKSSILSENEDTSQPRFPQFNADATASNLCKSSYVQGIRSLLGTFIKVNAEHSAKGFNWDRTGDKPVMDKTKLIPKRILQFAVAPSTLTAVELAELNASYDAEIKANFE